MVRLLPTRSSGSAPAGARVALLRNVSAAALVMALVATPAEAQLARLRGGAASIGSAAGVRAAIGATRPANMRGALEQQKASQERVAAMRSYVVASRQAAAASGLRSTSVTNGISLGGLYPVANIREAMALARGSAAQRAESDQLLISARAANDTSGTKTWDGAGLPVETIEGGNTTVSIAQTQSRALLSWDRMDIGANTTLKFDQKVGGVAQSDWIAVNRVVGSQDPTTILGKLSADASVYILNSRGVIFGKGSQTNLRSLVASSLELGNYATAANRDLLTGNNGNRAGLTVASLQDRNISFLRNGPLTTQANLGLLQLGGTGTPPLLLSPLVVGGDYDLRTDKVYLPAIEGDVIVDPGAEISAGLGGSIILAGPRVENSGILRAEQGQVSLVGGRLVTFATSTGEATSIDPDLRGIFLRALRSPSRNPNLPLDQQREDGYVINRGLIESKRGYLSLVATDFGDVINEGLLASTTSVSRNGKIALLAGRVTVGGAETAERAGGISILPDEAGETIPQGSDAEPASFKRSVIEIGATTVSSNVSQTFLNSVDATGVRVSNIFELGENSFIYAPNARVVVGRDATTTESIAASGVSIDSGAAIDVSGLKDIERGASRNFLTITPVKRNELRDTPNYREVAIGDDFTLNGRSLTVDIRRSGVRADGVKWIGSPLLEAGSLVSQIPVTVSELMTEGGDIKFDIDSANPASFVLANNARIDFSGGWFRYNEGLNATSRLVTADGRIVDIARADPNDVYVDVLSGFVEAQPRFGIRDVFNNPILNGSRFEAAYDEGRDAGSLIISASTSRIDGILSGSAYAGARQAANALRPTGSSTIVGDLRKLQATADEQPAGGFLKLSYEARSAGGATTIGALNDIVIYRGTRGTVVANDAQTLISDAMLSAAGLSAFRIETFGAVTFAGATNEDVAALQLPGVVSLTDASQFALAPGGTLSIRAGRTITIDGQVKAPSGTIDLRTVAATSVDGISPVALAGNRLRTDDDLLTLYGAGATAPQLLDIDISGSLSTAGLWVNDAIDGPSSLGRTWANGGSIRIEAAPNVFAAVGPTTISATVAADLSGSIVVREGASVNVSAGGFNSVDQTLNLSGKGGSLALINATTYARDQRGVIDEITSSGARPLYGTTQTVGFTPLPGELVPSLVPDAPRARVSIADGSIKGFGFQGGGTFTLVSPDITFGSDARRAGATHIGLDFLAKTGFGGLDLSANRSKIFTNLFDNGVVRNSAFFDTTTFRIRSGERLELTQSVLPLLTDLSEVEALQLLPGGSDLLSVTSLRPAVAEFAFDRLAANLKLGGLSELFVDAGGTISGAAQATITASKVVSEGIITLPGGTIRETAALLGQGAGLAVRDLETVFGAAVAGQYNADAENKLGLRAGQTGPILTNEQLFSTEGSDRILYFLGVGNDDTGIELRAGSITDLSGIALYDPRARFISDPVTGGTIQARIGSIVAGGTITTTAALSDPESGAAGSVPRLLNILPGARVDLSGTQATFDRFILGQGYLAESRWSTGGRLLAFGGGSIAGASINMFGGYADDGGAFLASGTISASLAETRAEGGVVEWQRPTIRALAGSVSAPNIIAADQIATIGADTLIVRNGAVFSGAVDLSLGKAFIATTAVTAAGQLVLNATTTIDAAAGSVAQIAAPYIRFASLSGSQANSTYGSIIGPVVQPVLPASVTFTAGVGGIDFVGGNYFAPTVGTLSFETPGDIRFTGVDARTAAERLVNPGLGRLNGEILTFADTSFDAARVYATTGTGNLQLFVDAERAGIGVDTASTRPFRIAAAGDHRITFGNRFFDAATPYSAGSYLSIEAAEITQNGHLAAPVGRLDIGSNAAQSAQALISVYQPLPTRSVTFADNSLTSVSGGDIKIPYGTTLDLKDYFFSPLSLSPLTATPVGELRIAGRNIDIAPVAKVDLSGGGDLFSYEFVSGVGGSRDVLDRFNPDQFSANSFDRVTGIGYQYADRRQVYAIVPEATFKGIAPFDPLYSADYGAGSPADIYGQSAGLSVTLDGSTGVPAGTYLLLPAHYALLDGAYRVVENVGTVAPADGDATTLLDGSVVVGGNYALAGTGLADSVRRSFTLQSKATFSQSSQIAVNSAAMLIKAAAERRDVLRPRLPSDAARLILSPLASLRVQGLFDTSAAAGSKGVQVDIGGDNLIIAPEGTASVAGSVTLFDTTLERFNAESLLVGGRRVEKSDGTTELLVDANSVRVLTGVDLSVPELLLTVGNELPNLSIGTSLLEIADGARLAASGLVSDPATSNYVIESFADDPQNPAAIGAFRRAHPGDISGAGSVFRLANGPERLIKRKGTGVAENTRADATFRIGAATLAGDALAIDTTRNLLIDDLANLDADAIALSNDNIVFDGRTISTELQAQLGAADRLTLRSPAGIGFGPGTFDFKNLVVDSPTIRLVGVPRDRSAEVTINAGNFRWSNSFDDAGACGFSTCGLNFLAPEATTRSLGINATEIAFGAGTVRAYGFGTSVSLTASAGIFYESKGSLDVGTAALTLNTPFIADRANVPDPRLQPQRPDFAFAANGSIIVRGTTAAPFSSIVGNRGPGARVTFGTSDADQEIFPAKPADVIFENTTILATAGVIDARASRSVLLGANSTLATPGWTKTFGDALDSVTVAASGGAIDLVALGGRIETSATTTFVSDTGTGNAGAISLIAPNGSINLAAAINPGLVGPRLGDFTFDSGVSAFDLSAFATRFATLFQGALSIRSNADDLVLDAGQMLRAESVSLTADGGKIDIGGTIDTSGKSVAGLTLAEAAKVDVDGGKIELFGRFGVNLAATAKLDTHTSGRADLDPRKARGGDVTLGIADAAAAIIIAPGAMIDVGARRSQALIAAGLPANRLVPETAKEPGTLADRTVFRFVEADEGGVINLRAPLIGTAMDSIDVRLPTQSAFVGARDIQIEAFRTFDLGLQSILDNFNGITTNELIDGTIEYVLDPSTAYEQFRPYDLNLLSYDFISAEGGQSIPNFIRTFRANARDGSDFSGIRLRPGVDITAPGAISVIGAWNLAAAKIDYAGAFAAGVIELLPELGTRPVGGVDTPYYRVIPGQEGALLERFADFTYRVDGKASGEAPVISLRARGNVTVTRSISDGFFVFRDKTDPAYVSYQLGGGERPFETAVEYTCGVAQNCSVLADFYKDLVTPAERNARALRVNLGNAVNGNALTSATTFSPLSTEPNAPGAIGQLVDTKTGEPIAGAALEFGELFPLLTSGDAIASSTINIVAGSDTITSTNVSHADLSISSSARIWDAPLNDENRYAIPEYRLAVTRGNNFLAGTDLKLASADGARLYDLDGLINATNSVDAPLSGDTYTTLVWGTRGAQSTVLSEATTFFRGRTFINARNPTGVIAPLSEVVAFLKMIETRYLAGVASFAIDSTVKPTQLERILGGTNVPVQTFVRTGNGAISVKAAGDIDLRTAPTLLLRQSEQIGGTSVYSAGQRVKAGPTLASVVGGGTGSINVSNALIMPQLESQQFKVNNTSATSDTAAVIAAGGGNVSIDAGQDILGRRDIWSEANRLTTAALSGVPVQIGGANQLWRVNLSRLPGNAAVAPQYFSTGVGALGGGDVSIRSRGDVNDLGIAIDTSTLTQDAVVGAQSTLALIEFGGGNLDITATGTLRGGQFDVTSGSGTVKIGEDVEQLSVRRPTNQRSTTTTAFRLENANATVSVRGSVDRIETSGLGTQVAGVISPINSGAFSSIAGLSVTGLGSVSVEGGQELRDDNQADVVRGRLLPPTLELASLLSTASIESRTTPIGNSVIVQFQNLTTLYPSPIGQFSLFSAGDTGNFALAMMDFDPSLYSGSPFSAGLDVARNVLFETFGGISPLVSEGTRRLLHNNLVTHRDDLTPIRVYSDGSIVNTSFNFAKAANVVAGKDIVDMYFVGQNVRVSDETRVAAGRDILGTGYGALALTSSKPFYGANSFFLGGPGTFTVEAGRDLGPFATSATINVGTVAAAKAGETYGGGILTVGNEYNPWLTANGADLNIQFGTGPGADYAALRETYLNPANFGKLDGDLFEQVADPQGNFSGDRTRQVYAPALATWLRDNEPALFAKVFGNASFSDAKAMSAAAYGQSEALYDAFTTLSLQRQRGFLVNELYFGELAQASLPTSPSFQQYIRGYRAVEALFPTRLGYTNNLAAYETDPATVSANNPLGVPRRKIVNGQPLVADRVLTGNADLRLATLQTARGGNINILAPGGDFLVGSVVRSTQQTARRNTSLGSLGPILGNLTLSANPIFAIPLGYEGILTLRNGGVRFFSDGSLRLNQSRLFTNGSGDITAWSSNGDLNAGQGPKSAANFPPVTVRFSLNGFPEVDTAAGIAGAGIGAFKQLPTDPSSRIILIAPVGEVDAGDAGVRASGDIFVAAARVANADNFAAGGTISGVPASVATAAPVVPTSAAGDVVAQIAKLNDENRERDPRSLISVDILGFAGGDQCRDPEKAATNPDCPK